MKIETKFDKGDIGFIIHNNKIYQATIEPYIEINYTVYYNGQKHIDEDGFEDFDCDIDIVSENELFATKAEAETKLKEMKGE